MYKTNNQNLSGKSETYIAPLYWKAMETQRPDAMIKDEKAVELVTRMSLDFSRVRQIPMTELLNAMRIIFTREMDRCARDFLSRHPESGVVHIGCGLDSRFERVEWYDLDLPEVIGLRRKLIGDEAGRDHFLGAELVFDGWRPFEVWLSNRYLSNSLYAGLMHWGFWRSQELEAWGDGIHLLDEWGFFDQPEPRLNSFRWMAPIFRLFKPMRIFHFQLGKEEV